MMLKLTLLLVSLGVAVIQSENSDGPRPRDADVTTETVSQDDQVTIQRYEPDPRDGSECYTRDDGSDYRGTVDRTRTGRTCQKWTIQSPHQHTTTPDNYPNHGLGDHNYCRNMDGATKPWCYTIDSAVRWEYCEVGIPKKECSRELNGSGVVYTRWGHSSCPGVTKLVYKGIMAGSYYSQAGNGGNYLCLPETVKYDDTVVAGHQTDRGRIYAAEYRGSSGPLRSKLYHNVPCAVCLQEFRNNYILYPARDDCPSGWTREYYGYLMASKYTETTSEYVCVDVSGQVLSGSSASSATSFLYPVESACVSGSGLPCAPYVSGYELSCAICSI